MQQRGMGNFIDRFAEVAADSDYSRIPALRGISTFDIQAAAQAMWVESARLKWDQEAVLDSLNPSAVEKILLGQVKRYDDGGELMSVEFEEYWDATDLMKFSSGLLEEMKRELVNTFLASKRESGLTVVNNLNGIWLFDLKERM